MKIIRKPIMLFSLITTLFFSGCEKEKSSVSELQEVSFNIMHVDPFLLKYDIGYDIQCPYDENGNLLVPGIAEITLRNEEGIETQYTPAVFFVEGKLYTQSIRLSPGTYTVAMLLLRTEPGGTIIMAIPKSDSPFAPYITEGKTIEFSFEVGEFSKTQVEAEVLCYESANYQAFGFFWFNIHQIVVKELCFFGDICVNHIPEYQEETAYGGNTNGSGNPWWYYFDASISGAQPIYAGQQLTDGTVTFTENLLLIDLGSWSLQNVSEPIKIQGFNQAPLNWEPPGSFDLKTNTLTIDLSAYAFPFYIIHLDIKKGNEASPQAPFSPDDFAGSLYEHAANGVQVDMPAIFKLHIYKNGIAEVPYSPFSNVNLNETGNPAPIAQQVLDNDGYIAGTSRPLCVQYPVSLQEEGQVFSFELYAWVPGPNGNFYFRHFYTFSALDRGPLLNAQHETQTITDGVLDFVIGNCNYFPPDLLLSW